MALGRPPTWSVGDPKPDLADVDPLRCSIGRARSIENLIFCPLLLTSNVARSMQRRDFINGLRGADGPITHPRLSNLHVPENR